jgi:hypothetical protein
VKKRKCVPNDVTLKGGHAIGIEYSFVISSPYTIGFNSILTDPVGIDRILTDSV